MNSGRQFVIEDPPLITLRRRFPRPSAAQVEALRGAMTGHLVDAMGGRGGLPYSIKPVIPEQAHFCGVAVTSHPGPADNLATFAALDLAQPGDVIVAATDGFMGTAVVGDLILGMMRNCGVVGFVTDGCVRDIPGIRSVGLPCHAAGVTPNSPVRNRPGTVGLPVTLGGVPIESGDVLVGDLDGVVVVPFARIDAVIAALQDVRKAESALEAKVQAGLKIPDFIRALLAGPGVRAVD
jgi:4-hydroxy-4-methyl-2-oxoglutarate aldolase